jgi:hypothetical protein
MVNTFLIIAGVLFLCGILLAKPTDEKDRPSWVSIAVAAVAAIAFALCARLVTNPDLPSVSNGAWLGGGGALVLVVLARFRNVRAETPIALGAIAASQATVVGHGAIFGLIAIAGALAIILGLATPYAFLLSAASAAAISRLATNPDHPAAASLGLTCATIVAAGAFAAGFFEKRAWIAVVVSFVIVVAGGYLASKGLVLHPIVPFLAAPVAGLAVWFLLPDGEESSVMTTVLAALIWLGLATLSFATQQKLGMAISLLMGAGVPLALGNGKAAGSAAALGALVWYQLLRSANPDLTSGSDLSQFYLLTGIVLGVGLCALAGEWRAKVHGDKGVVGGVLWAFLAASSTVLAQIVFEVKGLSGVLAGSGLGCMAKIPAKRPMTGLAITAIIGGTSAALIDWTDKLSPDDRPGKVHDFIISFVAVAVIAALLFLLQRTRKPAKES